MQVTAGLIDHNDRLDHFLQKKIGESHTKTQIKKYIDTGCIKKTDDNVVSKAAYKVKQGEVFIIEFPKRDDLLAEEVELAKQKAGKQKSTTTTETTMETYTIPAKAIPIHVVFEDADIAIIEKPISMPVHPTPTNYEKSETLVHALISKYTLQGLSHVDDEHGLRPGIVHRIDADTSGLLVVAKNDKAHLILKQQFEMHTNTRKYHAIVIGDIIYDKGEITGNIARHPNIPNKRVVNKLQHYAHGTEEALVLEKKESDDTDPSAQATKGKHSKTKYHVIERFCVDSAHVLKKKHQNKIFKFTLIECELETGRTHQIRVHLSGIGRPLLGDRMYGPKSPSKPTPESSIIDYLVDEKKNVLNGGQILHAVSLGFEHPSSYKALMFHSPIPKHFADALQRLRELDQKYKKEQADENIDTMAY